MKEYTILTISVLIVFILLGFSSEISMAQEPHIPIGVIELSNASIQDLYLLDGGRELLLTYSLGSYNVLASYDISLDGVLPGLKRIASVEIEPEVVFVTPNRIYDASLIAVARNDGIITIYNNRLDLEKTYGLPGKPIKILPLGNNSFMTILSNRNAVYIFEKTLLEWREIRLSIGDMIEGRENLEIVDIYPVFVVSPGTNRIDYSGEVLLEVKPPTVELRGIVMFSGPNFTQPRPLERATLYAYVRERSAFTENVTIGTDGVFTLRLPVLVNYTILDLYIEYNATCYRVEIDFGEAVIVGPRMYQLVDPIVVTPNDVAACPPRYIVVGEKEVYVVDPDNPLAPKLVETLDAGTKILLAYRISGSEYLHLWIWTPNLGIIDKKYTGEPGVAVAIYDVGYRLISKNIYVEYIKPSAASISPDARIVLIGFSNGQVYVVHRKGEYKYKLLYSTRISSSVRDLGISTAGKNSTYILAVGGSSGELSLIAIDIEKETILHHTITEKSNYYLPLWASINTLELTPTAEHLVVGTSRGLLVLTNIATFLGYQYVEEYNDLVLLNYTITVLDDDNNTVENFTINYKLSYNGVEFYSSEVNGSNGRAAIKCLHREGVEVSIQIIPRTGIHDEINYTTTCVGLVDNPIFFVPLTMFKPRITLVDKYSDKPPISPLNITIVDVGRGNETVAQLTYRPGAPPPVASLRVGYYRIEVVDSSAPNKKTYSDKVIHLEYRGEDEINIELERIPITLTILIEAYAGGVKITPQELDYLKISLEDPDGEILATTMIELGSDLKEVVTLKTLHRGEATIRVESIPPRAYAPFFHEYSEVVVIDTLSKTISIKIEPVIYNATLYVFDIRLRKPVAALIEPQPPLVVVGHEEDKIFLRGPRGVYEVIVKPREALGVFFLYNPATITVDLRYGSTKVTVPLERIRIPVNITLRDPISPVTGGAPAAAVELELDNKPVGVFIAVNSTNITLPIHVNGSVLGIKPQKPVYVAKNITLRPDKKQIMVELERTPLKLTLKVVDDTGSPLITAQAEAIGLDVAVSTTIPADEKGVINMQLPYGSYQLCVKATGYVTKCTSLSLTIDVTTTIVLEPEPLTLVKRYTDLITAIVVATIIVLVIRRYFKRVLETIARGEETI